MKLATRDAASRVAQAEIKQLAPEHEFQLIDSETNEHDYGWSFAYAPASFLRSHNPSDLVPGNGPLVVERSGEIHLLPSSVPPAVALSQFETAWRRKHEQPAR